MRILHILFNLATGGTETMMIDIMNCQRRAGHDVGLLLINAGHRESMLDALDPGVSVMRLNRPTGSKNPIWLWRYNRAIARFRPDAVHIHNKKALGMLYGPRKYKVVFTYHCNGDANPYAGRADILCAISQTVAADTRSRGEGDPTVVLNGIDTLAVPQRDPARPAGSPVRIVQIGSLKHEIKGQHITLQALAAMRHRDVAVDFIGEGPSRPMLESLAAELGVADRVRFCGAISRAELYASLPTYDIGLLPSLDEGFGLALAEPMAAGLPVVCTDLPGPMELVRAAGTGTSFRCGDAPSLAAAIDTVIDDYPSMLADAVAAREAVTRNFDIRATADNYVDIYRRQ